MHDSRWSLAGLLACSLPVACAAPCLDDGLGQSNCPPAADATLTDGATEDNTNTVSETMGSMTQGSNTDAMTEGMTADDTATETDGGEPWCIDADGDGFGDPSMCMPAGDGEPPPGTVDNDDDCDDTNPNTFPGAAENDDPRACMNDDDDDGWGDDGQGDDDLPPGVEPGTDCDDTNEDTFPGAAENEDPPDQCMNDADGDGWGDADPGGGGGGGDRGPVSGSDCYDENPLLNPSTLQLTVFMPYNGGPFSPRTINVVDPSDASFADFVLLESPMGGIPNVNVVSATFNEDMEIYGNDLEEVQLQSVDYAKTCGGGTGTITPVGMPYGPGGDIVCGLEFGGNGLLYGIGQTGDNLRSFDPATGEVADAVDLTLDGDLIDIVSCGMARDCTEERLLVANGLDRSIYSVATNGELELVRDLSAEIPAEWLPTGLEYDPVSRTVLLSIGEELWRVDINDDSVPAELIGTFEEDVSNLQWLPICM